MLVFPGLAMELVLSAALIALIPYIDDKFPNTVLFACDNVVFGLVRVVMNDAFAVMLQITKLVQ